MQDSHWGAERPASEPEQEAEFEGLVGFCQVKGGKRKTFQAEGIAHVKVLWERGPGKCYSLCLEHNPTHRCFV